MLLYTCVWCNICQCILYLYLNSISTQTNILYIYIYSENSLFSSAGLKGILQGPGIDTGIDSKSPTAANSSTLQNTTTSRADFEAALASIEDDEDVLAAKGVRSELAKDAEEMNEDESSAPTTTTARTSGTAHTAGDGEECEGDEEEGDTLRPAASTSNSSSSSSSAGAMINIDPDNPTTTDLTHLNVDNTTPQKVVTEKDENIDSELEFNKWQLSIGANDFITLRNALKPIERYALNYRENIELYQSLYKITELQRLESITNESSSNNNNEQWNIEEIEKNKEIEELRLFNEGEILAVNLTLKEKNTLQSWYNKERLKLNYNLLYRRMTGDSWCLYIDNLSNIPFWYNNDTGRGYILR